MKRSLKHVSLALLMAFLVIGAGDAFAQEYKETYNKALEAARAKKYDDAHGLFVKASQLAKQADDKEVAAKAAKVAAQIDYNLGKKLSDGEKYADALKRFENGIKLYPTYTNNYLGKAIALKKLEREDDAIATYKQLIEVGKAENDVEAANAGQNAIRDHFVFLASSALSRNGANTTKRDADEALAHLSALREHLPELEDSDYYYYTAVAQNVRGEYEQAIASATQALELHRGSKTDKAKVYFILGEAQMYKGDAAAARESFGNAMYGSYKPLAEHYLETLGTK